MNDTAQATPSADAANHHPPPELAAPEAPVRLDLGCGQRPAEGFEGVDLYAANAKHRLDLFKFPWPWATGSVDELHASHFVEHIPQRQVSGDDLAEVYPNKEAAQGGWFTIANGAPARTSFIGQNMFFAFFDEAYRILKPGGTFKVIVPALQSVRAFMDPTHTRFICAETFAYLNAEWRKAQGLDHYQVVCDFAGTITHSCLEEFNQLHPEAAARRFKEGWNTMHDFIAELVKRVPREATL